MDLSSRRIADAGHGRWAIRAGRVFDGLRAVPGAGVVLVEDGRVAGIEAAGFEPPEGWEVLDRGSGTVLPGLIDTHVHLVGDAGNGALDRLPELSGDDLSRTIEESLRLHLAAGVTTVRDLGDRDWSVVERRDRGLPGLPSVLAAGPPITSRGGHCWNMGGEAEGEEGLREAVRERARRGADVVKIMASGGIMTPGTSVEASQFTRAELAVAVEEAHAAGLPVTAHAHAVGAIRDAVAVGADGIEHCSFLTADGMRVAEDVLAALIAADVAVCPTLGRAGLAVAPELLARILKNDIGYENRCALFTRWHGLGVTIVSGTDGGINPSKPHGLLPASLVDLASAGMAPADALATATSAAADACGLAGRKGRILPGHDADLLVVAGDPLTDPAALLRPDTVFLAGRPAG
ncbi:amidohydrolase family protein [Actinocorallia longicatena]|uniref:Amidohydrolase family protein n=1 Tax=Actinocorallia longicatena TaxID=111803 RepID=A0ABP6QBA2_9ACTN